MAWLELWPTLTTHFESFFMWWVVPAELVCHVYAINYSLILSNLININNLNSLSFAGFNLYITINNLSQHNEPMDLIMRWINGSRPLIFPSFSFFFFIKNLISKFVHLSYFNLIIYKWIFKLLI